MTSQSKPVKLAIIGCGIAANELHWPALRTLRDKFEITVVCNNTEEKAVEFAAKAGGVPYVLHHKDLLQRDDVEAVDIVLPVHLNYEVTRDCLQAGKHVMVEKPIAATREEVRAMLALDREYPLAKIVGENFYYHPAFLRAKEHLNAGRIGKPYAAFWDVFRRLDRDNRYVQTSWRVDHKYPGGFIMDGGIHNIAALRLLFGEITSGQAFTQSVNPEIGSMDSFSLQFATAAGVDGVLNIFNSSVGFARNELVILGSAATMRIASTQQITITSKDKVELNETITNNSYVAEFEDFYRAIRTGATPFSSFPRACRDFEILVNAFDGAERKAPI